MTNNAPFFGGLTDAPLSDIAKHTAKNIHATDGSRTAQTAAFARGMLAMEDPHNHEDDTDNGLIVANPTAGFNGQLFSIDDIGNGEINNLVSGTSNRKGGVMKVRRGTPGTVSQVLVRAVGANIVAGTTLLCPNSAAPIAYSELREHAATTVAHLLTTCGATGACRPCATALEDATTTETASSAKLIWVRWR